MLRLALKVRNERTKELLGKRAQPAPPIQRNHSGLCRLIFVKLLWRAVKFVHPILQRRRITSKQEVIDDMQPHPESRTPIPFPGGSAIRSGGSVDSRQSVDARKSASSGNSPGSGPLIRAAQDGALDTGDDVRLIAQIADGQSGALSELYRRRGGALFRFLQRILGDAPDTEETLQDTFVAIWRRAGGYEPSKSGPLTWMT